MAYVPTKDEKEQDESRQGQPQSVPGSEAGAMQTGGAATVEAKPAGTAGLSSFTDVNAYLDANKEQGQQLASKIGMDLESVGQDAVKAADTAEKTFQGQVQAGGYTPTEDEIKGAAANPVDFSQDSDKVVKFSGAAQGNYNGPSKLEDLNQYLDAQTKAGAATKRFGLVGSEAGQKELLSGMEKNPTAGQTTFDQLIFGQNPTAVKAIQDKVAGFGDLSANLANKVAATKSFADTAAAGRAKAKADIDKYFNQPGGAIPGIQGEIASAVSGKRTALENLINGVKGGLGDYNWTPQELEALGLTQADVANIRGGNADILRNEYGIDITPSQYFTQTVTPDMAVEANTVTPAQIAKYNALLALTGNPNKYNPGTATAPLGSTIGTLNAQGLQNDLNSRLPARDNQAVQDWWNGAGKQAYDSYLHWTDLAKTFTDIGITPPSDVEEAAKAAKAQFDASTSQVANLVKRIGFNPEQYAIGLLRPPSQPEGTRQMQPTGYVNTGGIRF